MNQSRKRYTHKENAQRAYAYYKKHGIFGSFENFWRWLIDKPERLTALSTFAIFLATAVAVGVGIAQWNILNSTLETTQAGMRANFGVPETPESTIIVNGVDGSSQLNLTFVNSGQSTANSITIEAFLEAKLAWQLSGIFSQHQFSFPKDTAAGKEIAENIPFKSFAPQLWPQFKAQGGVIGVKARITFRDIYGVLTFRDTQLAAPYPPGQDMTKPVKLNRIPDLPMH